MFEFPDLPVRAVLDEVTGALMERGTAVLVAPPGTGKTTLVPLALAERGLRVVVAEPRRLATRAAARRMASLLGEEVGGRVGYSVRGERRRGPGTVVEVVTSGLLVRRLQSDPELAGVDVVMLDECHERHLDADLLLALLLDAREGLRPDLRVLATSATVAAGRAAELLGGAPVLEARARTYPVSTCYLPPGRGERIEACVARAVRTALAEQDGDVLAFLPGAGEIRRVAGHLSGESDVDVLALHGRLPHAQQDLALREGQRRRVVLATAVAESSLTVPGVRAVVDSGLSRESRVDIRRGLAGLATVRVSAAVADQRAGRAGRQGPGVVYRCWPEHEHSTLPAYPEPEIRTAELTRLALELACWGTPDGSSLSWWDEPPGGALAAGREVLRGLGALDASGAVTERGRRMAELGLHPRLARALLDGSEAAGAETAAEVVALLDNDALTAEADVTSALSRLRRGAPGAERWRREVGRLKAAVQDRRGTGHRGDAALADRAGIADGGDAAPVDRGGAAGRGDAALVVALAQPERLARRRSPDSAVYLMASGTAVELPAGSGLGHCEWLAVAVADRSPGSATGTVRLAAPADEELGRRAAPALLATADEIGWVDGDVRAVRAERLGAITLRERGIDSPEPAEIRRAVLDGLRAEGLELLQWPEDARRLRERLGFLHNTLGEPWPAVDDESLIASADHWLEPELSRVRRRADLLRLPAGTALRRLVPWSSAAGVDDLAPDRIEVPSGSRIRVDYGAEQPVLPVKLQEVFGWRDVPRIAEGRVPVVLHLLSPAGRPAAVTSDLESFWRNGYPQVRAELRGRYPKHPWPEDPATATPTARTSARSRR
ncbi:ATP-dependent helicase HrpB [Saccharopolyspora erythraea NRRL 2338]|uniref:ATP-dependent helicase HrpB n=2 Tax=Saccharopolyspora erythraea TaxID=1836 RepID=A4FED3_SACEN|nr:ATP-dependent helicase HrpB [Saccharopolyspora erythraea]EQD83625.1 ATP-dependent helicase [Saccharopolyspora erythraea D]PFG96133.1 ATP-dependent helicase HrpB [Saccharopolyspora erythraea NRRL 2338]QRK92670.1 ATP-dependent helicase HrpB [Saccharopolyspora erythraea]CAM02408.1 ATP-dependent helicase HrpB [Saccharopolyspora erythraea NRRL 2338]